MSRPGGFNPAFSTRAAGVLVETLWYLSWISVLISLALVAAVNLTDFYVKYTYAPLEIHWRTEGEAVSAFGQDASVSGMSIVKALGLQVRHYDKGLQRIYVIIPLALSLLLLGIITVVRTIMRSVRNGSPFTSANASRLKLLGLLVMVAGPFYGILEYIYGMMLRSSIDVPGAVVKVNPDARIMYVAVGIVILVIGQVFKYGVRLREDSELTI